jgi:hypothetical protein
MTDKRNKMRKPILTMREFELQHAERDVQLKKYMTTKRGREALDNATADTLKDKAALSLKANATLARVEFARALADMALKRASEMKFPAFLTLAPTQFSVPIADAPRFDVEKIIEWGKDKLKGCNHVTFVEAALYTNYQAPMDGSPGAVHWHLHSVMWGDEYRAVGIVSDMTDEGQEGFIPGLRVAHQRELTTDNLPSRFLYMSKAPLSEYRVYARTKEMVDPGTGEVFTQPTGRYIQRKRALRPGDASLLCRIMGSRDLPSRTFAGGEGEKLLTKAIAKAKLRIVDACDKHVPLFDGGFFAPRRTYFSFSNESEGWSNGSF